MGGVSPVDGGTEKTGERPVPLFSYLITTVSVLPKVSAMLTMIKMILC
jgi:hypothetical protein